MQKSWTTFEVKLIESGFKVDEIVEITGRSRSSVRNYVYKNKYTMGRCMVWSASMKNKLKYLSRTMSTDKEIGVMLNLSAKQVSNARSKFGFKKKKLYTKNDLNLLRLNLDMPSLDLAIVLGRTPNAIKQIKAKIRKQISEGNNDYF
ncbi:MAG: hypothetical protein ACRCZ2_04305 [Fusobacteriaceae bacterium]